ncbi:hypothetical protein BH20ACT5_BH20ACT5_19920 [soil metagenome]
MNVSSELKQYGEIVAEQGKLALTEARKSFYAVVGAGDLALERASEQGRQFAERLRSAEVRRIDTAAVREAFEEYVTDLTVRGEKVVHEFRKDPRVQRVIIRAESAVDTVEDALEGAIDEVDSGVSRATDDARGVTEGAKGAANSARGAVAEGAERTRGTVRKAAARNTNARKSTTRKAPARKSAAS